MDDRLALVTGASGFIGRHLVPALLEAGWRVRVLARDPARLDDAWRGRVEVVRGDATRADDLNTALAEVQCAYYLLHSMDGQGDYLARDRELATSFVTAARSAGVARIVYLGGLHPADAVLSDHLRSRTEVGETFLSSAIPTAVLQAGVVLGTDSASFRMLRHLSERLPVSIAPRWLDNRIQPIALDDVVHFLVAAASLPSDVNQSIDIGMDEVLTYREMMKRYARVAGLRPRRILTVPVLTPGLASHWVGVVTPVPAGIARPLVGSVIHDAVKESDDARALLGDPPGRLTGFDEAIRIAIRDLDPRRWGRVALMVGAGVGAAAALGSWATTTDSTWYRTLRKPRWQPPGSVFPIVWTSLYGAIWASSTAAFCELHEEGRQDDARRFARLLTVNLALNGAWSAVFFRSHKPVSATAVAAALAGTSAALARAARPTGRGKALALGAYTAWCGFATVLSGRIARLNRSSPR